MRTALCKRREKLNLTHDKVANKAEISRAYYSNIEAGRKDPSLKVMKRIADALGAKVDVLFFDQKVPKRNERGAG
ncbi:helix-turn-helix transcriptional regulator [Paenibacillus sp. O199]|uniref:helix-turn-helix transcriptional regulator n=1 Tax=Paenibacillus sp. O199 TaxID=1643925 RepID=UPI0007BF038E|nr:helix-turn-helix transcriptional regulator [Paenibacillus sp. O199]